MTDGRLPAGLEVAALMRAVQAEGGHAAVLHRGDPERGAILLFLAKQGRLFAALERILDLAGEYAWRETSLGISPDPQKVAGFLAKHARFDADYWAIELDIADPQRFIAENLPAG